MTYAFDRGLCLARGRRLARTSTAATPRRWPSSKGSTWRRKRGAAASPVPSSRRRALGAFGGCREFASDALAHNQLSHAMHRSLGFEETERVVFFRKVLP